MQDKQKSPLTKHKYTKEQNKNLNNHTRELLTYTQKVNQMKLKPGLEPFYAIEPGKSLFYSSHGQHNYSVSQKFPPPCGFLTFFPKRLGIFDQFLHTYYTFLSTLDYKFLFIYSIMSNFDEVMPY